MLLKFISLVYCLTIVSSESLDCEGTFDNSDCGLEQTIVYTHLSPLGMCHAAIWRGCPTRNKFRSEQQCLSVCTLNPQRKTSCNVPLNTNKCYKDIERDVYTYNIQKKACVKATWHGCLSENLYNDYITCAESCLLTDEFSEIDTLNELINEFDTFTKNEAKGRYPRV